jgi:hypothetical protein
VRFLALPLVFAAAPLAACVNTDTAVFVAPTLTAPSATVTMVTFGTSLTGSFTLDLHLGARAAGPSTVTNPAFSIVDAQATGDIVSLSSVMGDKSFPLIVQPDSDTIVHFTFDSGNNPLMKSDYMPLCMPAGVQIKGAVTDSLGAPQTPFYSGPFNPTCM